MSDIEIARKANKKPIQEIGAKLGIDSADLLPFGHDKAKVSADFIQSVQSRKDGHLVLVTAVFFMVIFGMVTLVDLFLA